MNEPPLYQTLGKKELGAYTMSRSHYACRPKRLLSDSFDCKHGSPAVFRPLGDDCISTSSGA